MRRGREWAAIGVAGILFLASWAYLALGPSRTQPGDGEPGGDVAARIADGVAEEAIAALVVGLQTGTPTVEVTVPVISPDGVALPSGDPDPTALDAGVELAGDLWPEALVTALLRTAGRPKPVSIVALSQSDLRDPAVVELLRRPPGRLDAELLTLVRDASLSIAVRQRFLAALARPDSPEALEGLVTIALDASVVPGLRAGVLVRLPRCQAIPPPRLDALLYLPFGGLDEAAALALARSGRVAAPSLVIDEAQRLAASVGRRPGSADRIVELARWAVSLDTDAMSAVLPDLSAITVYDLDPQGAREAVHGVISGHSAAHPEFADLPFERDRVVARRRASAAIALAPRMEDLVGLADDDIDFATAAFVAADDLHEATQERFERLLILLERELDGSRAPDVVIPLLRDRLHGPTRRLGGVGTDGLASRLSSVLDLHCGNCVGNSVLWIAVADRLGLPIRPVMMPGHAAVVWDDGDTRRIIETTAGGEERPSSRYRTLDPLAVADGVADDDILQPVSELALLASLASNRASDLLHGDWKNPARQVRKALSFARSAIALDPGQVFARVNFALAAARVGGPPLREAHVFLDEVAGRADLVAHERLVLCRAYLECGIVARAHEMIAPVEERFPKDERVIALRQALGR